MIVGPGARSSSRIRLYGSVASVSLSIGIRPYGHKSTWPYPSAKLRPMSIDRRSHTPVYRQLANLIRERIYSGQYAAGAPLPSESTLSQEYGVGRDAVRQALALLRGEGLVTTERGERSRVRETPERTSVELPPGGRAIARMPHDPERVERHLDEGVPVLEVRHPDGTTEVHPADRTEIVRPA